jgi:hypothetical protein
MEGKAKEDPGKSFWDAGTANDLYPVLLTREAMELAQSIAAKTGGTVGAVIWKGILKVQEEVEGASEKADVQRADTVPLGLINATVKKIEGVKS